MRNAKFLRSVATVAFGLTIGNVLIAGLYLEAVILTLSFFAYGWYTTELCFSDFRKLLKEHGLLVERIQP